MLHTHTHTVRYRRDLPEDGTDSHLSDLFRVCIHSICICLFTCIFTHIFIYMYINVYTHIHIYIFICTYGHIYVYACRYRYTRI